MDEQVTTPLLQVGHEDQDHGNRPYAYIVMIIPIAASILIAVWMVVKTKCLKEDSRTSDPFPVGLGIGMACGVLNSLSASGGSGRADLPSYIMNRDLDHNPPPYFETDPRNCARTADVIELPPG